MDIDVRRAAAMSADDIHIVVMTSDFNSCKKLVTLQLNKVRIS